MGDRECMTSHFGDTGKRNASSTRSTHLSGDDGSSAGYQVKIQRDTLYVNDPTINGPHSEWIVSYCSADGPASRSSLRGVSATLPRETENLAIGTVSEDLDLRDPRLIDPFNISRLLASSFFSFGEKKYVRLHTSLSQPQEILAGIFGVLMCSNIMDLCIHVLKEKQDSGEIIILVCPFKSDKFHASLACYDIPPLLDSADTTSIVSKLILEIASETLGKSKKSVLEVLSERVFLAAIRAIGTLTCEMPISASLRVQLEPSTTGMLRFEITKSDMDVSFFKKADKKADWKNDIFVGISLGPTIYVVELTSSILRLFMAGYCFVRLGVDKTDLESALFETVFLVSKYFEFSLKFGTDRIELVRKCQTQERGAHIDVAEKDRMTIKEGEDGLEEPTEEQSEPFKSVPEIISKFSDSSKSVEISVGSTDELMDTILGVLALVSMETEFEISKKKIVKIRPPNSVDWTAVHKNIANETLPAPPAASPDITVDGPAWESRLEEFEARLNTLKESDTRLSVLLVEKKLSGLGIWTCAQMSTHVAATSSSSAWGHFEVIAERAVRQGDVVLKNSVRMHIKRTAAVAGSIVAQSRKLLVEGSESRITLATELFAALNGASNGYIVMECGTPHCAFLALMAVIIVNGWSRSILQRVETRIFTVENKQDEEQALFLLRLILN